MKRLAALMALLLAGLLARAGFRCCYIDPAQRIEQSTDSQISLSWCKPLLRAWSRKD